MHQFQRPETIMDTNSIINLAKALELVDQSHDLIKAIIGTNDNAPSRLIAGLYWRDEVLSSLRRIHPHFSLVLDDSVDQELRSEIFEDVRRKTLPLFPDSWTAAARNIDTHEHLSIDENILFLISNYARLRQHERPVSSKPDYGLPASLACRVRRYIPSKSHHYARQGFIPPPDKPLREGFPENHLLPIDIDRHYQAKIESDRKYTTICPVCQEIRDANMYVASYLVAYTQGGICESTLRLALRSAANIFTQKLEDKRLLPLQEENQQTSSDCSFTDEKYLRSNTFWQQVRCLVEDLQYFTDQIIIPKNSAALSPRAQMSLASLAVRASRPYQPSRKPMHSYGYGQYSRSSHEDEDELFELIWQAADSTNSDDDLDSLLSSPPRTPSMNSPNLYDLPSITKENCFSSPYRSASSIPSSPLSSSKSSPGGLSRCSSSTSLCSSLYATEFEQASITKTTSPPRKVGKANISGPNYASSQSISIIDEEQKLFDLLWEEYYHGENL